MTEQDKGRRAKLMFELVAAEDARNSALNPTTTAVPFGPIVVRGERVYAADMRFCRAATMLAIDLRKDPYEAEVGRLQAEIDRSHREWANSIVETEEKRDEAARLREGLERRAEAAEERVKALEVAIDSLSKPDSALVAEVARLRGYLENIRKTAMSSHTTALIHLYASEALKS
jgi:hypothetical protein